MSNILIEKLLEESQKALNEEIDIKRKARNKRKAKKRLLRKNK